MKALGLALLGALAATSVPGNAIAQLSKDQEQRATQLFEEAKKLSGAGDYATACPKFEESRNEAPGLGVTLYLADCMEKTNRPARALELYREARLLAQSRNDPRALVAHDQITRLESVVPKLLVTLADPTPALSIKVDEKDLDLSKLDEPVRVEPGEHRVIAAAPGKQAHEQVVSLALGATLNITIPLLAPLQAPDSESKRAAAPSPRGMSQRRLMAFGLGGAGVVGLSVGAVFGLKAKSALDDSNANGHCDSSDRCDARGLDLRSDALASANVSTIAFVAGAALIGAGAYFFITEPTSTDTGWRVTPHADLSRAELMVTHHF
jgi:tetratricopeptide (TPR) repeat protein